MLCIAIQLENSCHQITDHLQIFNDRFVLCFCCQRKEGWAGQEEGNREEETGLPDFISLFLLLIWKSVKRR